MNIKFRDLRADEIEIRVGAIKEDYMRLMLYKDARVDMNILDETVFPENWQRDHFECKGNLFCRVGIKCNGEWIFKADCGTGNESENEKGEASDSFKRACVNWGIGRELYTLSPIWIKIRDANIIDGKKCYDKFAVEKIRIKNKRITGLSIINTTLNKRVFVYCEQKEERNDKGETKND